MPGTPPRGAAEHLRPSLATSTRSPPPRGTRANARVARSLVGDTRLAQHSLIMLDQPVRYMKGVGPRLAQKLGRLGIRTVEDLLFYPPRRYEDWRFPIPISTLWREKAMGEEVLIDGVIQATGIHTLRHGWKIFWARVADSSGKIKAIWFNQPFLDDVLTQGRRIRIRGKCQPDRRSREMSVAVREYLLISGDEETGILPYYSLTEGISQKWFRKSLSFAVQEHLRLVPEFLPLPLIQSIPLLDRRVALTQIHFPKEIEENSTARRRFIFEEFLLLQLALLLRRRYAMENVPGISFPMDESLRDEFISKLPFIPTAGQLSTIAEIEDDMRRSSPMNRLLQGDVGSGKTMVAAYAAFAAIRAGYQCAVMAPTEVLVDQHLKTFQKFLGPHQILVKKLTHVSAGKKQTLDQIENGVPLLVVGTHALIMEAVRFKKLGLVIIDEQHRFGVMERTILERKGVNPDLLMMTATPIPRSLALSAYGDLDRSVIVELPPGRPEIHTYYVSQEKRTGMDEFLRRAMGRGEQVFVVCPLVAESEAVDLKAAIAEAKLLQKVFPEFQVGLVHGRMKSKEKERMMDEFHQKSMNLLVSTTVIEVGVDVPNATIMVIEQSERFGLAQLHQLRGRIGRGEKEGHCFLLGNPTTRAARARIRAMTKYRDGFRLAELDLRLRGPGELTGLLQSGLPPFLFADIIRDEKVLGEARVIAKHILEQDPHLQRVEHQALKQEIRRRFGESLRLGRLL